MMTASQHKTRRKRIHTTPDSASIVGLVLIAAAALLLPPVSGWVSNNRPTRLSFFVPLSASQDVVDVDFEHVDETPKKNGAAAEDSPQKKTLLDLSLDAEEEWKEARVPFVDGENYIDAKLAFIAKMDGASYGIGIPFEPAVALTYENSDDGTVSYLSPDDDENEELMQLMAAQLQEHLGDDLQLKRTPRVLTVAGPLENYTKNWKENILPDPVSAEALLQDDDDDDGLEFFHNFMKQELGEEEYQKTLQESSDTVIDDELMSLFDIPGIGAKEDDLEGIEEMLKSVLDDPDQQLKALEELGDDFEHDGVALKLVSYILPSGKAYSLVQPLKPFVLVGKLIEAEQDTHFELLSPTEAPIVIPRLEQVCKEDFERAGLSF